MVEGVELVRGPEGLQILLRGVLTIDSGDGGVSVELRSGVALALSESAAGQLLDAARDEIVRRRVESEVAAEVAGG